MKRISLLPNLMTLTSAGCGLLAISKAIDALAARGGVFVERRRRRLTGATAIDNARDLGVEDHQVRIVCKYMGGGFGDKNGSYYFDLIAAALAST